jgi:hypothetical protein
MTNASDAPFLILRKESFGGIAFSSHEAAFLELDNEAFDALCSLYREDRVAITVKIS